MGLEATTSTSNPGKSIEDEELDLHQRDASRKPNRYLRMEAISNAEESTEHEELDLRQQAARERNHRLRMEAISNPDESTEHEELDLRQHEAARERNYRLRMEANNAASYKGKDVEVPQSSAEVNFSGTDLSENEETRQTLHLLEQLLRCSKTAQETLGVRRTLSLYFFLWSMVSRGALSSRSSRCRSGKTRKSVWRGLLSSRSST
jgi:hypothetical protein